MWTKFIRCSCLKSLSSLLYANPVLIWTRAIYFLSRRSRLKYQVFRALFLTRSFLSAGTSRDSLLTLLAATPSDNPFLAAIKSRFANRHLKFIHQIQHFISVGYLANLAAFTSEAHNFHHFTGLVISRWIKPQFKENSPSQE